MPTSLPPSNIVGVILAGGLSRRMQNQNKCSIKLSGKPLLEHVLARFTPQCDTTLINTNEQTTRLKAYGLPLVEDSLSGFLGPLAGILSAMQWCNEHRPESQWLASVAVDTPFLPANLVAELYQATQQQKPSSLACAYSNQRMQPVNALWSIDLMDDLKQALETEGIRQIKRWTARYSLASVHFNSEPVDPFFNINRPEDLLQAEAYLKKYSI